jgi:DNA replication protein DnaC
MQQFHDYEQSKEKAPIILPVRRGMKNTVESMAPMKGMLELLDPQSPPPDELRWTCPTCGVIEPLWIPAKRWIKRSCECQRTARRLEQERAQREAWLREQRIRCFGGWLGHRWEDAELAQDMCQMTFDSYERERFPEAYDLALRFANQPRGNIIFHGKYGTGKTHLEAAICNYRREVGVLQPDGTRKPMPTLFVSAPVFFQAYSDAINSVDKTQAVKIIEQAVKASLLIIDDVDKARPNDFRLDTYFMILDERYKAKRPTILSTNCFEELHLYVGEAVAYSRMMRNGKIIAMEGDDYRLEEDEEW